MADKRKPTKEAARLVLETALAYLAVWETPVDDENDGIWGPELDEKREAHLDAIRIYRDTLAQPR